MEPRVITRQNRQLEVELHENHPLRLQRASGRTIEALAGTIWITAYGELTDFELAPGQTFRVPNDRLTLVEAIGRGTVRLQQAPAVGRDLLRRLAGWARLGFGKPKNDVSQHGCAKSAVS